jgi:hypothetical protein
MSLALVIPNIAERLIRSHARILFVVGEWDRIDSVIDKTRTGIMNYATGGGRDMSNAHAILEPRGSSNIITLQPPRRGRVEFLQLGRAPGTQLYDLIARAEYDLTVAPDLDGSHSYSGLTPQQWAQAVEARRPPEPEPPPAPSVWEWLRKPGV